MSTQLKWWRAHLVDLCGTCSGRNIAGMQRRMFSDRTRCITDWLQAIENCNHINHLANLIDGINLIPTSQRRPTANVRWVVVFDRGLERMLCIWSSFISYFSISPSILCVGPMCVSESHWYVVQMFFCSYLDPSWISCECIQINLNPFVEPVVTVNRYGFKLINYIYLLLLLYINQLCTL